jgi:phage FluMu gp28-like protein
VTGPLSERAWAETRAAATAEVLRDGAAGSAAETGLPAAFLPYQATAVAALYQHPVIVVEKSRRVGLTWGLAAGAVLFAAARRDAGGMDALYISFSREMTREFVDACAMWAKAFAAAATAVDEAVFEDGEGEDTRSIQAFRIRFASGHEILALSSAPRSLRGKQGLVIVDEAAFVDNLKELMKAALAFLMWGGKVAICSTHDGATNPFAELVADIRAGKTPYHLIRIDLDQALADGLHRRICLVTGKTWSEEAQARWRAELIAFYGDGAEEELFCIPREGDGVWLSSALIDLRSTDEAPVLRFDLPQDFLARSPAEREALVLAVEAEIDAVVAGLDPTEIFAAGFDFARHVDLSVLWLLGRRANGRLATRLVLELRRWPYAEQTRILIHLLKRLRRLQAVLMDATGSGEAVAEGVRRAIGEIVVPLKLTVEWYRENMPHVRRDIEEGTMTLVADREVREDLRMVVIRRGVALVPEVRRGAAGAKRHGDAAIALALAHAASRTDLVVPAYRAAAPATRALPGQASTTFRHRPEKDEPRLSRARRLP